MIFSSINRIKDCIPHGDAENTYEASGVQFLRIGFPKIPHGLSPLSSASLYLKTHTSIPCARLANSLDSTFFSRYSRSSGGIVTVMYGFLRPSVLAITCNNLWKCLYPTKFVQIIASFKLVGKPNDTKNSYSDSYAKPGDHGQGHHHGMSGEQRGTRPRLRLGPPSVHGEEGGAGGHAGGLRPPALAGPLGSGLRLSGVSA